MRTLVTGGAGFIGSHVAEALVEASHEVLVLDDLSSGKRENIPAQADFAQVSITSAEAERVVSELQPEWVFHFAAQMDVRRSVADPAFDARTNVEGTARIASAAARGGCGFFLFASSGGAIYGEQEAFPAEETHPKRPESPYGLSKQCGELYIDYFSRNTRMRPVHLRFANVYGPRQDPHGEAGVVAIFVQKMLAGETPIINGDGKQTRDYVFVGDVARACLLSVRHASASGAFNIGTGRETDVNELAERLARIAGFNGSIEHGPAKEGEQRRSVLSSARAKRELHWQPSVELDDGLRETVEWFRRR